MPSPVLGTLFLLFISYPCVFSAMDSCYDEYGVPSRCMPKFENAAFNRSVAVSNTCGTPPEDYCMQTGSTRLCRRCDARDPETNRNATYLTDFHTDEEPTWWQSQSMFYGVQFPNSVNLTLQLGKAFEITYVHLKFYTSRPESFAIYRRTSQEEPWQPYQFYSASCQKTYGRNAKGYIRPREEERTALCTDEFSDISPLTGGNVAFSTLEGRPSAYNFDQSPVLQEWVTATDLLISLNRLNTFGDEFFKDPKVLHSYFYAISDFSVGGRCKCNGHASECVPGEDGRLACVCEHHTAGADCQRCAPFYQDRPWARATADSAHPCVMCNCSGHADECVFDAELYRSTGSGGRCVGCRDNTAGQHCQGCLENFYRTSPLQPCHNCSCNAMGSVSLQCDNDGVCVCRPSVMGVKCDVCKPGFHSLIPGGCRLCECDERGSVGVCSAEDGRCSCKANVEGHACNRCKPGSFNLQLVNPDGCQACFCFGHSFACSSSNQHVAFNITSDFLQDPDGWVGKFLDHQDSSLLWKEGEVYLLPYAEDTGYYKAPGKFLGNQLLSYGQHLLLAFTAETSELLPRSVAVVLEGSGISVRADLYAEQMPAGNRGHSFRSSFTLRLTEREVNPALHAFEFQRLLSNLTALLISNAGGQNYTSQLSGVTLTSATLDGHAPYQPLAPGVEACTCPLGFTGQFCERCAPGFTRETPSGGPYSSCVPCSCNKHGTCHPETGVCECADFTTGVSCERCQDGYYGNALIGNPSDCLPCPCPDRTTCAEVPGDGGVVCTNCPAGQRGTRCELCEDGFYGDPLGRGGKKRPCARCECSGNVDPNAVGVCDHMTGHCLKCLAHTAGDHCDKCQTGYYGNALDHTLRPSQKCKPCACKSPGTGGSVNDCDPDTGRCLCLSHVTGRDCGQCEAGYFNLQPVLGCEWCNCNPIGSPFPACQPITGQCSCRTGVEGRRCDVCRLGFFGFSSRGCRACNCDPMGSTSMQCHGNGTCTCRQGFVGHKCDKCELNFYLNHVSHQCEECPVCYSLIRDQASKLKGQLQDLERLLSSYDCRSFRHELYVGPRHVRQPKEQENQVYEHQSEDYLPNALEEFLAIQEAREAFTRQFSQLRDGAEALLLQLGRLGVAANCSLTEEKGGEGGEGQSQAEEGAGGAGGQCRALTHAFAAATDAHTQLRGMTLDLDSMVIPFVMPRGPTQWNTVVNQSEALAKSHSEMAAHIEKLAEEALRVSNTAYSVLLSLLDDNTTQNHIQDLTERLSDMQELKGNLTHEANETLAVYLSVQEQTTNAAAILQNITSTLPKLHMPVTGVSSPTAEPQPNSTSSQTIATLTTELIQSLNLANRTVELELLVQSKEQLVNKSREEMEAQLQSSRENLKTMEEFQQLTAVTKGLKETALSSVVQGKQTESEASSLQKHLEGLQKEWPVLHTHTRETLKRESILEEKILTEVKRKVRQAERALGPALDNATLASETATGAKVAVDEVAKVARATLSQGKQARKTSAKLREAVEAAGQRLSGQEEWARQAWADLPVEETDVSLEAEMGNMEAARSQLEAFTHTLAQLLSQLDGSVAVEKYERVLNETAAHLRLLRGSVEGPGLSGKMERLRAAAQEQEKQLAQLDQNLQDIRQERDSLTDIAQNLPKACPERDH